jgi:formylglycine-generating enzyme required for sulfatase activity
MERITMRKIISYQRVLLAMTILGASGWAVAEEPAAAVTAKAITNAIGMTLIYCPPGSFKMGSPDEEKGRIFVEKQVPVTISKGFYLGKTSITQADFKSVMGKTPWAGKQYAKEDDSLPATHVSWKEATEFCNKLTAKETKAGRLPQGYVYALPTEAQREYACRAGTTTAFSFGDDAAQIKDYAWCEGIVHIVLNDGKERLPHAVGQKKPNRWGFYDMHGNVYEWCRDRFVRQHPGGTDPYVEKGMLPVIRGGTWLTPAGMCRSAWRESQKPKGGADIGFRVALVPKSQAGSEGAPELQTK